MDIPESWEKAGTILSKKGEVVLVLGKTDSGKSTLVAYLIRRCLEQGRRVGVVDTDIGQASFGPPTCMSLTFWRVPVHPPKPDGPPILRFIGTTHPARRLLQVVVGAKLLVECAKGKGVDTVLIDSSGLVQGPLGLQLKQHKIELIKPTRLLVLQRGRQLEGLLHRLPSIAGMNVHRIPVASSAKSRSPGERRAYRKSRFSEYFRGCKSFPVSGAFLKKYSFREIPSEGSLVGLLNGSGKTLGLGVIRGRLPNSFELETPVPSMNGVRFIQPSTVRLNTDWDEMPRSSEH